MTDQQASVVKRPRRTSAEIKQIVVEFAGSGLNRSQFCRRHGMTSGTLNRYLQQQHEGCTSEAEKGRLVAVELRGTKLPAGRECGSVLTVVLSSGHRIEVAAGFDVSTLEQLLGVLERR